MPIAITTPTGHIGSRLTRRLFDAGEDLTLLVRNPEKLPADIRAKARIETGDLTDAAFVARATAGADALFWLTFVPFNSPDPRGAAAHQASVAAEAVRANRIARVVNLSSFGAHHASGYGPVSNVQMVENALNDAGENVLHLRPGSFMENYLNYVPTLRSAGSIFAPFPGDVALPTIATRDIGDAAAEGLLDRSWTGRRYRGLHGPADLTGDEAAAILGETLGRPVRHVQVSPEQAREALLGMGAGPAFADAYVEMYQGFAHDPTPAEPRSPETTTPTTLAAWAGEVLKPLVTAS